MVKFITGERAVRAASRPRPVTQMKANHTPHPEDRRSRSATAAAVAGAQKPTGPGLSEALGTNARSAARSTRRAPQSGTLEHADR